MTEKQKAVEKARYENAEKWGNFKGPLTQEKIAEMAGDNKRLQEMAEEATKEWLHNKGFR